MLRTNIVPVSRIVLCMFWVFSFSPCVGVSDVFLKSKCYAKQNVGPTALNQEKSITEESLLQESVVRSQYSCSAVELSLTMCRLALRFLFTLPLFIHLSEMKVT